MFRARARARIYKESDNFTHHFIEALEIVRDDLRLRAVYEAGLLFVHVVGVLVVALLAARAVRLILGGELAVDLPLHLHEHRREHAESGAAARDLQQTQYHVPLVLAHYQVVGLEEQALDDTEAVAAPADEVGDVVAGEEGAGLGVRQEGHVVQLAHRQRQRRGYRACHRDLAGLTTGHVVGRRFPHVVRVLKSEKRRRGNPPVDNVRVVPRARARRWIPIAPVI